MVKLEASPEVRPTNPGSGAQNCLQVKAFHDLAAVQGILPAWESLLAGYPQATTFSTWEWLGAWWRSFGESQTLWFLSFWDVGHLAAIAPLSIATVNLGGPVGLRELRLMGDGSGDSDNLDLPVRPGYERPFAAALLNYLRENRGFDICRFNTLPPQSAALPAIALDLNQHGWTRYQYERVASVIDLPDEWQAYLQRLSSEDQKNLQRYTKRLEKRYPYRIFRVSDTSELPACLEALFRLHQQRWERAGEPGSFASEERRKFYYDLSRELLNRNSLELWVLELQGNPVAVQYAFRYRDTVFQLQEGFDPAHATDRVGVILRGHVMKQLIAEGVRKYDFLGGEPGYKARWGAERSRYIDIHFARPFTVGSFYLKTAHNSSAGKEWLRTHLPQGAWSALHKANLAIKGKQDQAAKTEE